MAEDLVLDVRSRKQGYSPESLPYIEWERVKNPGLGAAQGEQTVRQKTPLFDAKGGPFVWLDPANVNYYLNKGWKIVGYGNFDSVKMPNGQPFPQLEEIRGMVTGHFQAHSTISAQSEEIERLKSEIAKRDADTERAPAEETKANGRRSEKLPQAGRAPDA